jgi:hypothetical protein
MHVTEPVAQMLLTAGTHTLQFALEAVGASTPGADAKVIVSIASPDASTVYDRVVTTVRVLPQSHNASDALAISAPAVRIHVLWCVHVTFSF